MAKPKGEKDDKSLTVSRKAWLQLKDIENSYLHSGKEKSLKEIAEEAIDELAKKVGVKK